MRSRGLIILGISVLIFCGAATAPQFLRFDGNVLNQLQSAYKFAVQVFSGTLLLEECSEEEKKKAVESGAAIEKPMSVKRINAVTTQSGAVNMTVKVETPNPCWQFSRYEVSEENGKYLVTVYGIIEKDVTCIQMIGSFDAEIALSELTAGDCTVSLWCNEETRLDTTLAIPE